MTTVHQIYCTHCTHGSSALERREGEFAHRMLGYSARAGSVEAAELRRFYRQVERYTYYYLPRDTPAEEKLRLTPATAPPRMFYLPSAGGLQLLGQVCYRQTDTEGRPGSYFAHVLFRDERDGPPWSPLECLKLWNAKGWTREDSFSIPYLLRPLAAVGEVLHGLPPAIDDAVLHSFLTADEAGLADPQGVIPPRWRQMDAAQRRQRFLDAFSGLLESLAQPRGALLVAVEPSLAALWFYGMLRLLPPAIRDRLSFSTFEPNPERVCTTLAATWFHDPSRAELRADAFRGRGVLVSTLEQHPHDPARQPSAFARLAVERLAAQGFAGVEQTLAHFQGAGAQTPADLEALAEVDAMAGVFLAGGPLPQGDNWRRSPMATAYFRRKLVQDLSAVPDPTLPLQRLIGRPQHVLLLELLAGPAETPAVPRCVAALVETLPPAQAAALLASAAPAEHKVAVLARHVAQTGGLPPGCEALWDEPVGGGLLPHVLARLTPEAVARFFDYTPPEQRETLIGQLAAATGGAALTRIVQSLDEAALLRLLVRHGAAFFAQYPENEPAMGQKLHLVVRALPDDPAQFSARLDLASAGERLLPSDLDQESLAGWRRCRKAFEAAGPLQRQKAGALGLRSFGPLEDAFRQMVEGVARALPADVFDDDRQGTKKLECLASVGRAVLGEELLPRTVWQHAALWHKARMFFELRKWPTARLSKAARMAGVKPDANHGLWLAIGSGVAALLVLLAAGLWYGLDGSGRASADASPKRPPAAERPPRDKSPREPSPPLPLPKPPAEPSAEQQRQEREEAERQRLAREKAERERQAREAAERMQAEAEREAEAERLAEEARQRQLAAERAAEEARRKQEAALTSAAERERQWLASAREFAQRHRGIVLHKERLLDGVTRLDQEVLPLVGNSSRVYLGAGRIETEEGTYAFGQEFEASPPTARQDVPALAKKAGFAAVQVGVQARNDGLWLLVSATPAVAPAEAAGTEREELKRLESVQSYIIAKLADWRKLEKQSDSEEKTKKQRELREALRNAAGIQIPPAPPQPNPQDPKFLAKPDEYRNALGQYQARLRERERAIENIPHTARESALPVLNAQIEQLKLRVRERQARVREENDRALREWKGQLRTITAIVYLDAVPAGTGPSAETPPAPPTPDPPRNPLPTASVPPNPPSQPAPAEAVVAAIPAEIQATKAAGGVRQQNPYIAKLEVLAVAAEWARTDRDGFLPVAVLREHRANGEPRRQEIAEVYTRKDYRILAGVTKIEVCLEFYRRGPEAAAEPRKVGATTWQAIGPIEPGDVYDVRINLNKQSLEKLQAASR